MLVSICIPSYNRPNDLIRLLESIDGNRKLLSIIIAEDYSPKRDEIISKVNLFKKSTQYSTTLILNDTNLGYDKNIRNLIQLSNADYIIFMGDDDVFIPGALNKLLEFLQSHPELGYVLKSHRLKYRDGSTEPFNYYRETRIFPPGEETYVNLFRKSVFISGFTIKRKYCVEHLHNKFDGTLLQQLYLLAEVVLQYPAAYFHEPLTEGYDIGVPEFGRSDAEKNIYTPGVVTIDNSLNFLSSYVKIINFIDLKYGLSSKEKILRDMSNYSFPSLALHRDKGISKFVVYIMKLHKIGFSGKYFFLYCLALLFLGVKVPRLLIILIKKLIGRTPQLK